MKWRPPAFNFSGKGNATANLIRHRREHTTAAPCCVITQNDASLVAFVRAAPHIGQSLKMGMAVLTADDSGAAGEQPLHAVSRFEPCASHAAAASPGNG
jgi:hypothetical protein